MKGDNQSPLSHCWYHLVLTSANANLVTVVIIVLDLRVFKIYLLGDLVFIHFMCVCVVHPTTICLFFCCPLETKQVSRHQLCHSFQGLGISVHLLSHKHTHTKTPRQWIDIILIKLKCIFHLTSISSFGKLCMCNLKLIHHHQQQQKKDNDGTLECGLKHPYNHRSIVRAQFN